MKHAPLEKAENNLLAFLRIRRELGARVPLQIMVIHYRDYADAVRRHLGVVPSKAKEITGTATEPDFGLIWSRWKPLLDHDSDRITRVRGFFGWAEREQCAGQALNYSSYTCPALDRVRHEVFIAPDGTWYACCMDAECELVLGNVVTDSLTALLNSPARTSLIRRLESRDFASIGGPCKTVQCCQTMYGDAVLDRLSRFIRRSAIGETVRRVCDRHKFLRHLVDRVR